MRKIALLLSSNKLLVYPKFVFPCIEERQLLVIGYMFITAYTLTYPVTYCDAGVMCTCLKIHSSLLH